MHLLQVSRPAGWLGVAAILRVGMAYGGAHETLRSAVITFAVTLPYSLVLFGLNDLADARSDRDNPRKGSWLHGGRVDGSNARATRLAVTVAVAALLALAAALALHARGLASPEGSDGTSAALLCGLVVLAWLYSSRPVRLKEVPILDGLASAAIISGLLALGYVQGQPRLDVPREPVAFVPAMIGIHTFASLMDVESDRAAGHRTLAVRAGPRVAGLVALGLTLITVATIPLVEFAPAIAAAAVFQAVVIAASLALPRLVTPRRAFVVIGAASGIALLYLWFVYL